jgi:hypothetical protein
MNYNNYYEFTTSKTYVATVRPFPKHLNPQPL